MRRLLQLLARFDSVKNGRGKVDGKKNFPSPKLLGKRPAT